MIARYFAQLPAGKLVLWCYLAWYAATVAMYFDPRPSLWLNSLGISGVVGSALLLSVRTAPRADPWQTFRLYMMPFGVSSFSALIKNRGFFLVFAPDLRHLSVQLGACAMLLAGVLLLKAASGPRCAEPTGDPVRPRGL